MYPADTDRIGAWVGGVGLVGVHGWLGGWVSGRAGGQAEASFSSEALTDDDLFPGATRLLLRRPGRVRRELQLFEAKAPS